MAEVQQTLPPHMEKIVEMFGKVEGRDKLELLLDYSASMPKVPDALKGKHEEFGGGP